MAKSKKGKSGGKSKGTKKEKGSKKDKKGTKGSKKGKKSKKDMEAAKLRAAKEDQERAKKEAEEKAIAEKKLAIELKERPGHLIDSLNVIQTYDKWVIGKLDRHKSLREWKSFKTCRNIPEFTKLNEVNTYLAFWLSQLDPPGMKMLLRLSPELLQLASELHTFLEVPPDCMALDLIRELGLTYRDILDYQKTYLDKCTYSILEDVSELYDPEVGICDYLLSIPEITHCLWGNIFQCPDINEHEFEELRFKFKIPESLLTAAGIYRLIKTEYDHYSDSCLSYFPPGVENALKQSIIDWMELHKMTGGDYYDLPSPVEEKPEKKGKGKGKKGKKGSKKKKGKKGSKGKKKGKKGKGDDTDLSDIDDDMKFLLEEEEGGKKKKKGKKKGKGKKGKKGKKGGGGGGATTTDESGMTTTDDGGETSGEEEEGEEGTTTGGEEGASDHEAKKASKVPTDAELIASTKETKEERRARRRREAELADHEEDNFDGGGGAGQAGGVEEEGSSVAVPADKKKGKDKGGDKDDTGDDEESRKGKSGKKADAKGKGGKGKKGSTEDDEAGPVAHQSHHDYDDDDADAKPVQEQRSKSESKSKSLVAQEEKKKSEGAEVEEGAIKVKSTKSKKGKKGKKGGKSRKKGNMKKSKKKKKSGKKSKKEKAAERKDEVKQALNAARGKMNKEGTIKTEARKGKKSKKAKTAGSDESLGGGGGSKSKSKVGKKGKGDKKGKSKSKLGGKGKKGDSKGSKGSKGTSKEKDKKKDKKAAKSKSKAKSKAAKSKSKSPGKTKSKKGKGGSKSKKDKKKDKGKKSKDKSKSKGKGKKGKSRSKKKGKKGKKGKTKSKERHKTEAELAKERERAEKAKFIPQLHEHELNLRNYTILGGVFDFNLYCIPPQPKVRSKWTVHLRESDSTLKEVAFEADYVPPVPPGQETAKQTPEEMEREAKHQEEELQKLLLVNMDLPEIPKLPPTEAELEEEAERQKELLLELQKEYEAEKERRLALLVLVEIESPRVALWFEPPTPVRWDPYKKIWSTEGFYDIRFNESNLQLSFRTVRFGTLAFGHNRWSNLPYQSWEIKPLGKDKVSFSLVAAMAVVEFIVFGDLICVTSLQNVTNSQEVEDALLNKYMKPKHLIKAMRYHGLDLFPEIDSYAYVDGVLVKHFESEDHLYQCMAVVSTAFNFQWSRWNLLAGREKMIYQMRERHGTASPGNYSMALSTPRKTLRINCTEVSPNYTEEPVEDNEYHADLLNLVKSIATEQGLKVMNQANPHHVEALRVLLASVRPLSFS